MFLYKSYKLLKKKSKPCSYLQRMKLRARSFPNENSLCWQLGLVQSNKNVLCFHESVILQQMEYTRSGVLCLEKSIPKQTCIAKPLQDKCTLNYLVSYHLCVIQCKAVLGRKHGQHPPLRFLIQYYV